MRFGVCRPGSCEVVSWQRCRVLVMRLIQNKHTHGIKDTPNIRNKTAMDESGNQIRSEPVRYQLPFCPPSSTQTLGWRMHASSVCPKTLWQGTAGAPPLPTAPLWPLSQSSHWVCWIMAPFSPPSPPSAWPSPWSLTPHHTQNFPLRQWTASTERKRWGNAFHINKWTCRQPTDNAHPTTRTQCSRKWHRNDRKFQLSLACSKQSAKMH